MSNITRLTQAFYQERQASVYDHRPQEMIEASHVGWGSVSAQLQSFEVATNLAGISWPDVESVLDIGCGYGRLLDFLISSKLYQGNYWGIDIIPEFVEKAIRVYSSRTQKSETQFLIGDFLEQDFNNQTFDVVISIGGLSVNHDYPDPFGQKSVEYTQTLISKMVSLSRLAISLYFPNIDNIDATKIEPRMAYYETAAIEAMLLNACGQRCKDMKFVSYPDKNNVKTMVLVKLSQ